MPTHREVLDMMAAAAAEATAAAMAHGYARDSPEVERSAWLAAHEVYRRELPEDFLPERDRADLR